MHGPSWLELTMALSTAAIFPTCGQSRHKGAFCCWREVGRNLSPAIYDNIPTPDGVLTRNHIGK